MPVLGKKVNWSQLVGHSVLVIQNPDKEHQRRIAGNREYYVAATSPSGRVKLETFSGSIFWQEPDDYLLVEDLGVLPPQ